MDEKFYFTYQIKIYTEGFDSSDIEPRVESGLVCATSLSKAVKKLERYYGNELDEIVHLGYLYNNDVLPIEDEQLFQGIKEQDYIF